MTIAEGYTPLHLWIDGQKLSGGGRDSSLVLNPSTGDVLAEMPHANGADLANAVGAAERGFKTWRAVGAVKTGAKLRTGGGRIGQQGFYWQPTVLSDVPDSALVMNEEPFGPVAAVAPFSTVDEVVEKANRLPYGLAAYAFTRSATRAALFSDALESGLVGLNTFNVAPPEGPFGGVKQSGYGSEGGSEGIDSYLVP